MKGASGDILYGSVDSQKREHPAEEDQQASQVDEAAAGENVSTLVDLTVPGRIGVVQTIVRLGAVGQEASKHRCRVQGQHILGDHREIQGQQRVIIFLALSEIDAGTTLLFCRVDRPSVTEDMGHVGTYSGASGICRQPWGLTVRNLGGMRAVGAEKVGARI